MPSATSRCRRLDDSTPSGLDDELTIDPDRSFVLANADPLVRAVHPLKVLLREAKRQEAEHVLTQIAVVARICHDDHEIRRNDRVGNNAPDRALQGQPQVRKNCPFDGQELRR